MFNDHAQKQQINNMNEMLEEVNEYVYLEVGTNN